MSDAISMLKARVAAGVAKRWPNASKEINDRIAFELSMFERCGRVEYCLTALGVAEAIRKAGGLLGPGRGACASSAVLYALGITNVDPLKHGLLFEMFMTPERKVQGTIFFDTDTRGDAAARDYLKSTYGEIRELPRRVYAPQILAVQDWEIGVTRMDEMDRLAQMLDLIRENGGGDFDLDHLPERDEKTWACLGAGNTSGILWFDSAMARELLVDAQIAADDSFARLCLCGAVSYPGLIYQREEVLRRIHDASARSVRHPLLKDVCEETLGLVVYHEQIMRAVRQMAGFTRHEAYRCRKAIGFRKMNEMSDFREKFITGCLANPDFRVGACVDEQPARKTATEIWNDFERCGIYTYMKSHMVCAATIAYRMCYLKAHYPAEWIYLDGKAKRPVIRRSITEMHMPHIRYALMQSCRVTLLMRHAERPPLEPGDTSFGERLALTSHGVETARSFAASLPEELPGRAVRTYAGNTLRTIQTATCINEGLRDKGGEPFPRVPLVPELGSDSPFFGKLDERMALISEGHYRDRLNDYFRTGTQRGYNPLKEATDRMEASLDQLASGDKALVIAVTHDINVAAFLAGRGVVTEFDETMWPHYLDAAVIIRNDEGGVEYGYLRFDDFLPVVEL